MYKIRKSIWETSSSSANALAMISKGIYNPPKLTKPFKCIRAFYDYNGDGVSHLYLSGWMEKMAYLAEDTNMWHNMFKNATGQDFEMWVPIEANDEIRARLKEKGIFFEEYPKSCERMEIVKDMNGYSSGGESVYREPEWGYICGFNIDYMFTDLLYEIDKTAILVQQKDVREAIKAGKTYEASGCNYDEWVLDKLKAGKDLDEALLAEIIFNPGFAINIGGDAYCGDTHTIPTIGCKEDKEPLQRKYYVNLGGYYKNGTEQLLIGRDGTRIRIFDENSVPEWPESIDLKITDKCTHGCEFCYENCTPDGKHGKLHKCLESLPEFVELAIGGGNLLANPDYEKYLSLTRYVNVTLHAEDFLSEYGIDSSKNRALTDYIKAMPDDPNYKSSISYRENSNLPIPPDYMRDYAWYKLVRDRPLNVCWAIGISVTSEEESREVADVFILNSEGYFYFPSVIGDNWEYRGEIGPFIKRMCLKGVDTVIHVVNGVVTEEMLKPLYDMGLKLLVLGYKNKGRGVDFSNNPSVEKNQKWLYENIREVASHFNVVAFDTLALKQLDMKRYLTKEQWDATFMGEDGMHSMYIDLVNGTYGISSTDNRRWPLTDDVREMFRHVRAVVREDNMEMQSNP